MRDASFMPPGEALKFRIFIVFCLVTTVPLFPISIAILPIIIGLYVAFVARVNPVKNQKVTNFYFLPIAIGLALPIIASAVAEQISGGQNAVLGVFNSVLHFSIFERGALDQISGLEVTTQHWFASVVLFGLFAVPLAYFACPTLALISKGIRYELGPIRETDDRISRFVKRRPSVALVLAILLLQVSALFIHIGLVIPYESSSEIFSGFKAQTFIESLRADQNAFPFMYLLGNGVMFTILIFFVSSAANVWGK